jgi:hypothetical protein
MTTQARRAQQLYVIPYKAPFYELLLSGKLTIPTESGSLAVKTGSTPRKHRGWVGFYNSTRVATGVAELHGLNPIQPQRVLLGVGYLAASRGLTEKERYSLTLGFNNMSEKDFYELCRSRLNIKHPEHISLEDRYNWLDQIWPEPPVCVIPMNFGHFYLPESLKRFSKPIPLKYPSGPVLGTHMPVTAQIQEALTKVGVSL